MRGTDLAPAAIDPLPRYPLELSDVEGSSRVNTADRMGAHVAVNAPDAPNRTEELDAADILEVMSAVGRVDGTAEIAAEDILEVAMIARREPASLAPFALDVDVEPRRAPLESTVQTCLPEARRTGIFAVGGALALCALIGIGALVTALVGDADVSRPAARFSAREPRRELAAANDEMTSLPSLDLASVVPRAAAAPRTGILRLPPGVHGLLVDGVPRKASGSTTIRCGRHAIKIGASHARVVDVPCGGSTSI